jgi:hypothetical protein
VAITWALSTSYHKGVKDGRAQVTALIEAPNTGWRARLSQCSGALATQNATMKTRSEEAAATLAAQAVTLREALDEAKRAQKTAAAVMRPLKATERCARLDEVDRRLMDMLK